MYKTNEHHKLIKYSYDWDTPIDPEYKAYNATTRQVGGDHYKDMAIQPGEFIVRNNIPWFEANAIKYIVRHTRKGGPLDIDKAIHYLEMAKEYYYK